MYLVIIVNSKKSQNFWNFKLTQPGTRHEPTFELRRDWPCGLSQLPTKQRCFKELPVVTSGSHMSSKHPNQSVKLCKHSVPWKKLKNLGAGKIGVATSRSGWVSLHVRAGA